MPTARMVTEGLIDQRESEPRLVIGRCPQCAQRHFPAAPDCPYCGAGVCTSEATGARARLWLHTVVNARPPGYQGAIPYGFGIVELDDGLRVVTRLTESNFDRLSAGQAMRLVIDEVGRDDDGTPILSYAFAPADHT
jgi:uncharacterized protein